MIEGSLSDVTSVDELAGSLTALARSSEPLAGLDLVLLTSHQAQHPRLPPLVVMELGTFRDDAWTMDLTRSGETNDSTPHLAQAIILQTAARFTGPTPDQIFAPIPRSWLLAACAGELAWWDTFPNIGGHPIRVRTAVLNACRARRYALEGVLCSKQQGGEWALHRSDVVHPRAIRTALALQAGDQADLPEEPAIRDLVQRAASAAAAARSVL